MNENILFEGIILNQPEDLPFGNTARDYEQVPKINSVEEFEKQESKSSKIQVYVAPAEVLNSFLVSKFGYNITDFMRMYGKAHFKNLGLNFEDNEVELMLAIHHIPENVVCFLEESNDALDLSFKLYHYQSTVIEDRRGRSYLNLHDESVRKFTLIRAKFDLEAEKQHFNYGYHFSTEKFRIFIKSSAQFDLSIVYEEL